MKLLIFERIPGRVLYFLFGLGAMSPTKREWLWKEKRVFFMTPQVLQNDLARGSCIPRDIVCLVFDEAHRALGSHAYSQVLLFNLSFDVVLLFNFSFDVVEFEALSLIWSFFLSILGYQRNTWLPF